MKICEDSSIFSEFRLSESSIDEGVDDISVVINTNSTLLTKMPNNKNY